MLSKYLPNIKGMSANIGQTGGSNKNGTGGEKLGEKHSMSSG